MTFLIYCETGYKLRDVRLVSFTHKKICEFPSKVAEKQHIFAISNP
jgi:hypothetical protein